MYTEHCHYLLRSRRLMILLDSVVPGIFFDLSPSLPSLMKA